MTRAWTKESDAAVGGSAADRLYQGILGLSDNAWKLIGRSYERQWATHDVQLLEARQVAMQALGEQRFQTVFSAAAERTSDTAEGPKWWAAGDAAVAVVARRHLEPEQYQVLVQPLAIALPWLKTAQQ
jgi:hypothetical protein